MKNPLEMQAVLSDTVVFMSTLMLKCYKQLFNNLNTSSMDVRFMSDSEVVLADIHLKSALHFHHSLKE